MICSFMNIKLYLIPAKIINLFKRYFYITRTTLESIKSNLISLHKLKPSFI